MYNTFNSQQLFFPFPSYKQLTRKTSKWGTFGEQNVQSSDTRVTQNCLQVEP
jgi:hypothetical protein